MDIEILKKELFRNVMEGKWEEVQKTYEDDSRAPTLKITKSGHTALHLAVSDAKEDVVVGLVAAIQKHGPELQSEALRIGNDRGQAALHLAAAMGNVPKCKCIATADRSLIGQHNIKGETPLFWAVLYGQKEAFRCLHNLCLSQSERYSYARRISDGQTILHCTLEGEDLELALEILDEFKELVNLVDDKGESPLHTLARKPSCFKSGTDFRGWENILYTCTFVNKPKKEISDHGSPEYNKKAFIDSSQLLTKAVGEILTTLGLGKKRTPNDEENQAYTANNRSLSTRTGGPSHRNSEDNIASRFDRFGTFVCNVILVIFGYEFLWLNNIRRQKEKHLLALQIVDELAKHSSIYHDYNENLGESLGTEMKGDHSEITSVLNNEEVDRTKELMDPLKKTTEVKTLAKPNMETDILVAAKNGVSELVDIILSRFPVAIHDADKDRKNMLLLAAENRHSEVYKRLLKYITVPIVIHKVDDQGNTALHLAAKHDDNNKLWPIPGAALQMQWEIKWYRFVEKSMPPRFFVLPNKDGQAAKEIFTKTHEKMVKAGSKWPTTTSTACSVVNTIIATVVFTSCTTYPGSSDEKDINGIGKPNLLGNDEFNNFMNASLVSLCFSVISLVMFLAILTSRHQENDFATNLPRKLLFGLTSLFISIAAMLTSFCSGHLFAREDKLKNAAVLLYAVTFLPTSLFAAAQFPLYIDLVRATYWHPF